MNHIVAQSSGLQGVHWSTKLFKCAQTYGAHELGFSMHEIKL